MGEGVRSDAPLGREQSRFLLVLAVPAFGISLAYTMTTTYVPVLLDAVSGPLVVGALIGAEGLLALFVPLLVGGWSDRLRSRFGGRLPFIVGGAALAAGTLFALPLGRGSLTWVGLWVGAFFVAYFVCSTPYYALFPDLVPAGQRGRSQGFQGAMRALGLLLAMAAGGLLLVLWRPLPFLVSGGVILAGVAVLVVGLRAYGVAGQTRPHPELTGFAAELRLLLAEPGLRRWAIANTCWEAGIGSLRTFVVLYFTVGLGLSLHVTSASLALVGVAAIAAAPVAGKLADRYGANTVMQVATVVFALGLLPTLLTTSSLYVVAIVPVAFAAVVLITLPYVLLMHLLPEDRAHGAGAGLFGFSRGVGLILGPVLAGLIIQVTNNWDVLTFEDTHGYAACFGVTSVFLVLGLPLLRALQRMEAVPAVSQR